MSSDVKQPPAEADGIASAVAAVAAPEVLADSFGEYVKIWWTRIRGGDSGALPVLPGLIAIIIYFQASNSQFLSAGNLVNLMTQAAWIVMAAVVVLGGALLISQAGCHSSTRLPSGSVTQPNRPTPSMSCVCSATSAPASRNCPSIASRSRTRKLSMVCWARDPK